MKRCRFWGARTSRRSAIGGPEGAGTLLGGGKAVRVWDVDVMEDDVLPVVAILSGSANGGGGSDAWTTPEDIFFPLSDKLLLSTVIISDDD